MSPPKKQPKKIENLEDVQLDSHNANRGAARGDEVLRESLKERGSGRSVVVDASGKVIAGNKTVQAARDLGMPVRVVESDGSELVIVQRTDLDLKQKKGKARRLAYDDNMAAAAGIVWDEDIIIDDFDSGVGLDGIFLPDELDEMREAVEETELRPPEESTSRDPGDSHRQIKMVMYAEGVAVLEAAILATGIKNRGAAIIHICARFLENEQGIGEEGQHDPEPQGIIEDEAPPTD